VLVTVLMRLARRGIREFDFSTLSAAVRRLDKDAV